MPEDIDAGGLSIRFLRSGADTGGALDMFEVGVQPRARMPVPHYHRDWEETVYGLEGVTTFTVAGQPQEVRRGDSVFVPRGVVHGFDNLGDAPARFLSVLTPAALGPQYFREIAAVLSAGGAPDPARIGEIMQRYGLVPVPPG